jgi:dihydroneopterin aldolase/D-erythro-7,8-dihydroneopterin triphosphate epimerase
MSDTIFIDDLLVRCIIGIHDWERKARQDVLINIELDVDTAPAGASDDFADAVDYRALAKRIIEMAEESGYQLVEALAEEIARLCLEDGRVENARVRVEKPGAIRFAHSVGVTIERERG